MRRQFEKWIFVKVTFILLCILNLISCVYALSGCFSLDFVLRRAKSSCIVAYVTGGCSVAELSNEYKLFQYLRNLLINNDQGILIGFIDINDTLPDGTKVSRQYDETTCVHIGSVVLFEKIQKDKQELYSIPQSRSIVPFVYKGIFHIEKLTDFINQGCNAFLNATGGLSKQGLHRKEILRSKFYVKNVSYVQSKDVFLQKCSESDKVCFSDRNLHVHDIPRLPECERIPLPTRDDFFRKYLKKSRPVIFKRVLEEWPAFTKWTNKYLREKFGEHEVTFQLTPHNEFERIEPINIWENRENFKLSRSCADQIPSPDLVMVNPAIEKRNLSVFMDILDGISNGSIDNMSAYLQYASIPQYLPELEKDIREEMLFKGLLKKEMLNIWLSDGRTLGKLHFDAYDNFLCQISGRKQVILFDPHNNHQLYEGHIQEASMSYNFTSKSFQRLYLKDTTVQVFSPLDITNPNYTRFPLFGETYPMNCTIEEGDVLYLPSFWWHEVQSFPNITAGRNLAINFWYEPFLTRDYPCPECQLEVNPNYRHLL